MKRQFDARETEKVIKPVDGLERHTKGTTPSTERTGHRIVLGRGRTEDRVDHRRRASKGKPRTCAGFIEHGGLLGRLIRRSWRVHRCPAMADDGQAIILLHHVAGEVATRPKLHQRCCGAAAHGMDFVRGENGHGGVHRPGPFVDPNFCSGYGRERSGRPGVTGCAIVFPAWLPCPFPPRTRFPAPMRGGSWIPRSSS